MNTCLVFRALTSRATYWTACNRVSVFFVIYSTQWINISIGHKTDVSQFNSRPSLYSWTLLMAYSKGKLKTNVDKAFPCFSVIKLSCYHQAGTKGEKTSLLLILDLSTRRGWVVRVTAWPCFTLIPLDRRLWKNPLPLPRIKPWLSSLLSDTILTELPHLISLFHTMLNWKYMRYMLPVQNVIQV
jgi:hypothetical protein